MTHRNLRGAHENNRSNHYEWGWELTDTARRDFDGLDEYARDRIASKLDEIVNDEWRDPRDHLEPLHGAPHQKLRVGPFRLGCRTDQTDNTLYILRIRDVRFALFSKSGFVDALDDDLGECWSLFGLDDLAVLLSGNA